MYKKSICKKCKKRSSGKFRWNYFDEVWWKQGRVLCPIVSADYQMWDISNEEPPDNCLYYLEQIVSMRRRNGN